VDSEEVGSSVYGAGEGYDGPLDDVDRWAGVGDQVGFAEMSELRRGGAADFLMKVLTHVFD